MPRLDGYVADLEYVHNFCREFAPSSLNFVLAMQMFEPIPLKSGFSSCDLGCGHGLSTNVFAACHPEGDFHGIDFNYAHILGAREMARKARLENVTFWEAAFEDLAKLDLPEFDFITLHGVYSWVNSDNRNRIVDFIRCKLKTGGVVYVSYNCLPGWAPVAPIRQLLVSSADMGSCCLEEQINASLAFVGRFKSLNVAYFEKNPSAAKFFDDLCKRSRNYLAHEYLNENWIQFYHSDVVKNFAPAGITFVGSANFADNLDFLNFSPEEQELIDGIENSAYKETAKDFIKNQQFRKDVFVKGGSPFYTMVRQEFASRVHFALVVPKGKITMTANFPRGEARLETELYEPLLHALNEGRHSLEELLLRSDIAWLGSEKVYQALMVLLSAGYILPAVDPSPQALASTRLFNYAILEQMALKMEPQYLASPVVQTGIEVDWVQRVLLLCELSENGDPLTFVSSVMREQNYALIKDGAVLQSWEENIEELGHQISQFYSDQLPLLIHLGVI